MAHLNNQAHLKLCPLCRVPINEEAVVKKVFQKSAVNDMTATDAFALDKNAALDKDNALNENEFAVDANAASPYQGTNNGLMAPQAVDDNNPTMVVMPPSGQLLVLPPQN